jgi:FG-GAP-like repeat
MRASLTAPRFLLLLGVGVASACISRVSYVYDDAPPLPDAVIPYDERLFDAPPAYNDRPQARFSDLPSDPWIGDLPNAYLREAAVRDFPQCEFSVGASCVCADGRTGYQGCGRRFEDMVYSLCDCADPIPPATGLPPRLLRPFSGLRATTQRPTFRWVLPSGVTRAHLDLCDDRACTRSLGGADVTGDFWRPTDALRPGVVFWRVRGLRSDGSTAWTSAVWEVGIRHRDTPVDSAWGPLKDFNGDGYDDVVAAVYPAGGRPRLCIYAGSAAGVLRSPVCVQNLLPQYNAEYSVGDVNGDGLTDIAILTWTEAMGLTRSLYHGARSGPIITLDRASVSMYSSSGNQRVSIADYNGDGFGDVVTYGSNEALTSQTISITLGGANGLGAVLSGNGVRALDYTQVVSLGDLDGDGYGDLLQYGSEVRAHDYSGTSVLLGVPGPTFSPRGIPYRRVGGVRAISDLYAADIDGDGGTALFTGSYGLHSMLRVRNGHPTLAATWPRYSTIQALTVWEFMAKFMRMARPGDFDADGWPDVALSDWCDDPRDTRLTCVGSHTRVYFGARGVYSREPGWMVPLLGVIGMPGDINGDGFDDLVDANDRRSLVYFGSASRVPQTPVEGEAFTDTPLGSTLDYSDDVRIY